MLDIVNNCFILPIKYSSEMIFSTNPQVTMKVSVHYYLVGRMETEFSKKRMNSNIHAS